MSERKCPVCHVGMNLCWVCDSMIPDGKLIIKADDPKAILDQNDRLAADNAALKAKNIKWADDYRNLSYSKTDAIAALRKEIEELKGKKKDLPKFKDIIGLYADPEPAFDPNAKPIEEIIEEIAKDVPAAEWEKLDKEKR